MVTTSDAQRRKDRKYTAFWAVFLFSGTALFFDKLAGDQWVTFMTFVFGLYMAGNVGAHYTQKDRK
jgi:hypothetical protein